MNVSATSLIWSCLVFVSFIASVCLHEFGHAIVAYWGGDRSVKEKGYLTLNPLKYTHPTYSIVMPLIFLSLGGLPLPGAAVYINIASLKGKGWRSAVSAAGPLATLLVAVGVAVILHSLNPNYGLMLQELVTEYQFQTQATPKSWLLQGLVLLLELEVAGVILNLIPIPGLDGFGIIEPWLPQGIQQQIRQFSRYGVLVLFAAFWVSPQFNRGFWSLVKSGTQALGVPAEASSLGFALFRENAQLIFVVLLVGLVIVKQWQKHQSPAVPQEPVQFLEKKLEKINSQLAFTRNAELLAAKSSVLTQMKRYEEALLPLEQSLALNDDQSASWAMKGHLYQLLRREHEAIAAYQRSLELNDQNPDCWQAIGLAHVELNQYDAAIAAYDQAISQAPTEDYRLEMQLLKSRPLFHLQQYEECLALLDEVLATQPSAIAWYNWACCHAQLGQIEPGIQGLTKALASGNEKLQQEAQQDSDLDPLRSHPKFAALVKAAVDL